MRNRDEFIKGMEDTLKPFPGWNETTFDWKVHYVLRPHLQRSKSIDSWIENHTADDLVLLARWLDDKLTISEKYEMDKLRQVDELQEKIRRADFWLNITLIIAFALLAVIVIPFIK